MECGLRTHMKEPVPLKHIEVDVEIQSHVATVNSTLQYVNEQDYPLEAVFVFPMPSGAALCQFSAKIADQEIVAELQEKQEAREKYDDALSSGEEVFLLEESEMSDDVFKLSVGSLPPGQSAAITFVYITELSIEADHSLRFCLPAVLNPRYTPAGLDDGIVSEITSVTTGIPYSLSFTAHMSFPNPITKVESKSLLEPLMFLNTDHTEAKVSLCPGHMFDRDVELYLYYQNPHQLTAIVEAGAPTAQPGTLMRDPVVMISFYPEFPESVMSSMLPCGEFVFVMDRSGSMNCAMHNEEGAKPRIECARDTLLLLLKSLPMGCFFNIYGFGSTYKSIFSKSVQYSQQTMEQAVKKIKNMQADMGGTDILEVLEHIYKQAYIPKHPRQLFIFTDGEVGNTEHVLQCVRKNASFHRCFSFGIGEGASSALITGLAENSSGHAQFITGTESMQAKVMQSLHYALQPTVIDITEDWTGVSFTRLSPQITTLFHGQRALIYAQLKEEECQSVEANGKLTVQYKLGDQEVLNTVYFSLNPAENSRLTIHRLGARSLIHSLERDEQDDKAEYEVLKSRVVELSKQCGVISSHTAFIAVHKGSGKAVKGPLLTSRISTTMLRGCALGSYMVGLDAVESSNKFSNLGMMRASPFDIFFPFRKITRSMDMMSVETLEETPESTKDDLLQLISLQKASGYWKMESKLAEVFGKTEKELVKQIPAQVNPDVWATLLALVWLHGFKNAAQVEWQLLAKKAVAWIRTQKVVNLSECIQVGNSLLGCQVEEDALGL
ncbi:von Willebrand factor A domain-containing protein 5A-like isoform X2 [Silurus meridionalis]|uniref:von Willebrand factor A domain-containing protein 5A-like isoform X2 n=1 Tax=Silurus meridionalis TaxID=175797 RepID=UPI001EEBD2CB|nr:von Willebrand factor A domain-containing protein 5A-like isoform X2 [Silurus meridionalis]